ncbi:GTP-binding protein EngA [Cutibacterium acnes JCM 18918]|nr:GTP-binding protein EngA [Cutibacterium acnes JCM 18918]
MVAANKVDNARGESEAATMWNLGLGEPHPVSAMHGRGSGDLLDALIAVLPKEQASYESSDGPRRVAIVGKPNVASRLF